MSLIPIMINKDNTRRFAQAAFLLILGFRIAQKKSSRPWKEGHRKFKLGSSATKMNYPQKSSQNSSKNLKYWPGWQISTLHSQRLINNHLAYIWYYVFSSYITLTYCYIFMLWWLIWCYYTVPINHYIYFRSKGFSPVKLEGMLSHLDTLTFKIMAG